MILQYLEYNYVTYLFIIFNYIFAKSISASKSYEFPLFIIKVSDRLQKVCIRKLKRYHNKRNARKYLKLIETYASF